MDIQLADGQRRVKSSAALAQLKPAWQRLAPTLAPSIARAAESLARARDPRPFAWCGNVFGLLCHHDLARIRQGLTGTYSDIQGHEHCSDTFLASSRFQAGWRGAAGSLQSTQTGKATALAPWGFVTMYVVKVTFEEDVEFQIHSAKSKYVDQEPFDED